MSFIVAACQMDSQNNKGANVEQMADFVDQAAQRGADLIAFPEVVTYMGSKDRYSEIAESVPGPTTEMLRQKAADHGIFIHSGSFIEEAEDEKKFHNTSVLISDDGEILDTYRKIHLFDVSIDGEVVTEESEKIAAGDEAAVVDTDLATFGLTICYDLRFPELYSTLSSRGADVLFVPAAFTLFTGKDHWHALLRARAIENQAYVVAPGQIGDKPAGVPTYGKSIIVDPWGNVISQASDREELIFGNVVPEYTEKVREQLPSLKHKRPDVYDVADERTESVPLSTED